MQLYGLNKKNISVKGKKAATLVMITVALLLSAAGCGRAEQDAAGAETVSEDEGAAMAEGVSVSEDAQAMVAMEEITAGEARVEADTVAEQGTGPGDEDPGDGVSEDTLSEDATARDGDRPDAVSDDALTEETVPGDAADGEADASVGKEDAAGGVFTSEPIPDEVFARMMGVSYPAGCSVAREDLRYLRLSYHDFAGGVQVGEMVCSKKIADDLVEIFRELYRQGYQIEKMRLIDDYGGDDDLSCADNNTSCFNYRTVAGSSSLSKHALGLAVDINPFYNPYVTYPDGVERISPPGSEPYADRSADFPHKIGPKDAVYELFRAHGFKWGGSWKTLKDYQHFQKT